MDAKTWRRSVMSDEEARDKFLGGPYGIGEAVGAVLDEFVRRLGEMRKGTSLWQQGDAQRRQSRGHRV